MADETDNDNKTDTEEEAKPVLKLVLKRLERNSWPRLMAPVRKKLILLRAPKRQ